MNKTLELFVFLVIANSLHADLGTNVMLQSKVDRLGDQMSTAMAEHAENEQKEKRLELDALLLIDSSKVIDDCIKNIEFLKLKTVYDKMSTDAIYARPNKEQIEQWREVIKEHIIKAKADKIEEKKSHAYLKKAIANSLGLGIFFAAMMCLPLWGASVINENANKKNYLAKYAIDAGTIMGFPLSTFFLLKLILQLIPNDKVQTLQKMNSILLLFEQLNETHK